VDGKSPYGFGSYIYVRGADDMPNNSLYRYGSSLKPPALTPVAASGGKISGAHHAQYGTVITLESSAPETPMIQTRSRCWTKKSGLSFATQSGRTRFCRKRQFTLRFRSPCRIQSFGMNAKRLGESGEG